jgi:hypothetical protein
MDVIPKHLELYQNAIYWRGARAVSGYEDYAACQPILDRWCGMVHAVADPSSVLDIGAAYGFVVDYFDKLGIPAMGVEPSKFCLKQIPDRIKDKVMWGALPDQGKLQEPLQYHTVTCTEVLEHVPEDLVPSSLRRLADVSTKYVICLIMLDLPEAYDDEGHICLKSRDWWEAQFDATGLRKHDQHEAFLNSYSVSKAMNWSGRIFVREHP